MKSLSRRFLHMPCSRNAARVRTPKRRSGEFLRVFHSRVFSLGTGALCEGGVLRFVADTPPPALSDFFQSLLRSATASAPPMQVTVAAFTASGLRVLGRGCAERGGTATGEAAMYDRVCRAVRCEQAAAPNVEGVNPLPVFFMLKSRVCCTRRVLGMRLNKT